MQLDRFPNIPAAFFSFAQENPALEVYSQATSSGSADRTYKGVSTRVSRTAYGLQGLGVKKGSAVAILSSTRPEWMEADLGILTATGITVSIYQSLPPQDVGYILFDSGAQIVFAENQEQVEKLLQLHEKEIEVAATEDRSVARVRIKLAKIICFENSKPHPLVVSWSEFCAANKTRIDALPDTQHDDLAALVYTSGTTGPPKGVMQTHGNHLANVRQAFQCGLVTNESSLTLFLPLAHSFAKLMGYIGFLSAVKIAFPGIYDSKSSRVDPTKILADIRKLDSRIVPVVPRFLEKMKEGIEAKSRTKGLAGKLLILTLRSAIAQYRKQTSSGNLVVYILTSPLRRKIRINLFGPHFQFAVSGGAKLPLDVAEFFASLGIPVLEGFGLTETCVATNVNIFGRNRIGTVGPVLAPDIEMRLSVDGEIQYRGPNIAKGYYLRPTATRAAWDSDGWFSTGDLGSIDQDGYLSIVGRKKEILVTAGGKKIAPLAIENELSAIPLVSQALLVGDGKPYCIALLALDRNAVAHFAEENGISQDTDFSTHAFIRDAIRSEIEKLNSKLSSFETVKNFLILPEECTVENGLMTPTFKVKRSAVTEKYGPEIERLYAETVKPRT